MSVSRTPGSTGKDGVGWEGFTEVQPPDQTANQVDADNLRTGDKEGPRGNQGPDQWEARRAFERGGIKPLKASKDAAV